MEISRRIVKHPILAPLDLPEIYFTFNGQRIAARDGEVISSALYAAGITILGHHQRDQAPQGIFCANGQCSQCLVIADNKPVKACMTPVRDGMVVTSCDGWPHLGRSDEKITARSLPREEVTVLVVGGGPAGLAAAIELGHAGVATLVVDDKASLGGKLTLQTHSFFGSVKDCWAGTRGIDIAQLLARQVAQMSSVRVWLEASAVAVYQDGLVGIVKQGRYHLVKPDILLIATGAREKTLVFPGCDLPGVYGAGAFQTLVNRDRIRAAQRLFVVGGGNVGLIGAYHALQAGIEVVGLVEALPECGGYKVHADKIRRLGVPIWTSHTVLQASGKDCLEEITIAQVDDHFRPLKGTQRRFAVDTLLIAVGLAPVDELYSKAKEYGFTVYAAGDAEEIAEASAAIFSGRLVGRKILQRQGYPTTISPQWKELAQVLRSRPGKQHPPQLRDTGQAVQPLIRCIQEIPCNPCTALCPHGLIQQDSIMSVPRFEGTCLGCGRCVAVCPGLAISLLCNDYDPQQEKVLLILPFEFNPNELALGQEVMTVDWEGNSVGRGKIIAVRVRSSQDRCHLVSLEIPAQDKLRVAGFRHVIRKSAELVPGAEKAALVSPDSSVPAQGATPAGQQHLERPHKSVSEEVPLQQRQPCPASPDINVPQQISGEEGARAANTDSNTLKQDAQRGGVPSASTDSPSLGQDSAENISLPSEDPVICRCGRVRESEILREIRAGVRDMNQLKATTRIGMGGCGGKTCISLILNLYRREGIPLDQVTLPTKRPLDIEVPFDAFV